VIEKIVAIQNVGKFEDYRSQGDVSFRRLTLIYGENASGKTTLSAILRSMRDGNSAYVDERRRLGSSSGLPRVELRADDKTITYDDGHWTKTMPDLEVFDDRFVTDNVFAGHSVEPEQRRKLHRFAIGEEAVRVAQAVDDIAAKIESVNANIREAEASIRRHILGDMEVSAFIALDPRQDIDHAITGKERDVAALKKAKEIGEKEVLSLVSLPEIPFSEIRTLLSKTLPDIGAEAVSKVKEHLARHCNGAGGEGWVQQGLGYIKEDRCPFCGQSIKDLDLVKAYQGYFSAAYAAFKDEIRKTNDRVKSMLSESELLALQERLDENRVRVEFWKQHVDGEFPELSFGEVRTMWEAVRSALVADLESKAASPLEVIDATKLDGARKLLEKMEQYRGGYNERIARVNKSIVTKKSEVASGDLPDAERELARLRNTKRRYERAADEGCSRCRDLEEERKKLESEKKRIRRKLEGLTGRLLTKYQNDINRYLRVFGADFSIIDTCERLHGAKPRIEYRIAINDQRVDLEAGSEPGPCFGNTLSSGDRTTLALAFFLARLDADENLEHKVVVFDDPLSSLDNHRRTQTQQQVAGIAGRASQVVVLSHDPYFMRLVWENSAARAQIKTLCTRRKGDASIIAEWNIEEETRGEYFRNYFALAEYLENGPSGDMRDVARCIRPLLEANLRLRFPKQFRRDQWLGEMVAQITNSDERSQLARLKPHVQEIEDINDYSKQFHHSTNPDADSCPITDGELRSYVARALRVISGVLGAE